MQDEATTMYKLAEKLKALRDKKQDTEQKVKDITAELNAVEQELVAMMTETETQNFTRAGTMFSR